MSPDDSIALVASKQGMNKGQTNKEANEAQQVRHQWVADSCNSNISESPCADILSMSASGLVV